MTLPKVTVPHIQIKTFIKALVLIGAALAIVALTVAVIHEYRHKQITLKQQHQAELVAAEKKGYEQGSKETTKLRTQNELWKLECNKGSAAYAALTTSQKRLIKPDQIPNCQQAVLQQP